MKNRVIAILGSILFAMLVTGGREQGTIYLNWNIRLPFGGELVYEADSGPSFYGDGTRYHVFRYRDGSVLEEFLDWQELSAEVVETVTELLDEIDVPEDERTDFAACRFRVESKSGNCWIYIFADDEMLYVIEDLR